MAMAEDPPNANAETLRQLAAREKLNYMHEYAKTSTVATVLAPLLCVPLYIDSTEPLLFIFWFGLMALMVSIRFFLLKSLNDPRDVNLNLFRLNIAVGIVTFVWGIGWFIFVPTTEPVEYLLYQIISLTILFVGMVGYCVNWKTFFSFVLPLKIPELLYIVFNHEVIIWPIALGSMVAFYLALKMGYLFSQSWEKSFSLRVRNDALVNQLIAEKNASIEANIAKSAFISTASHDLRQPMQAVNIFIEMINPENLKEYEKSIFARLQKSVAVLNKMFNTLLDISKIDSNLATTHIDFTLSTLVQDLRGTFDELCQQKNLTLDFDYEDCIVQGDPHLLDQVLRNLLSNAIQYTDSGTITVTFERQANCLALSVKDQGCGIPAEDLSLIFNEFYRSEHSRSRYDGLGLGLSIVNRILKKIGGRCEVESEVGRGSNFKIQTPFTVASPHSFEGALPARNAPMAAKATELAASDIHIGIIENDVEIKQAYIQYFTQLGYKVHAIPHKAEDFFNYLLQLPKLHYIVSDYRLGEHDGIYFIQKLREEYNDDIPACIVTADTSPNHLELFSQHHIHVLYKPIEINSIANFINRTLHS
jgi:signal transduction histidine kinase/CheY-like chemotaxis protein